MQNKGIVIVTAILLTLASIFYLSFSAATSYYDSKAAQISDPIAQQNYKDSVKYLGVYTYQQCLETQIGLGLDLKGSCLSRCSAGGIRWCGSPGRNYASCTNTRPTKASSDKASMLPDINFFLCGKP